MLQKEISKKYEELYFHNTRTVKLRNTIIYTVTWFKLFYILFHDDKNNDELWIFFSTVMVIALMRVNNLH